MKMEKYVMEEDWDFLIILDACRYDYFNDVYKNYFEEGKMEKAISPAIWTLEWAEKNFREYYGNIIYISTAPSINSKKKVSQRGCSFDAKKHFWKILDVWDWGWDDEMCTVRPEKVNEVVMKEIKKEVNKKFIIHYMQPHAPYLSLKNLSQPKKKTNSGKRVSKIYNLPGLYKAKNFLLGYIMKNFGTEAVWHLNKIFHFREVLPAHMEMAWRVVGKEGLRKAYKENLNIVLDNVKKLVDILEGKIVITSDHGELLGEEGLYGHGPPLPRHKKLIEIPWLTIEGKEKKEQDNEKEELKQKIQRLKRIGKI